MSNRIHALPLHLANQIAAGEVVERPASVLKELVENSIDAGASHIDIRIEGAGSQLIKVTDNGGGIHPDDLSLALSRHATSKLHSSEQLSHIDSLGFRGEALPSIASVSRLTLSSKQADETCGWQLSSDEDKPQPTAHPDGTSVSVAELFFNLPARRRFLRSDKTELHHLITTFNRLALSRFDIGFNAHFADQNSIKLPALTAPHHYHQRIARLCGQAFVREAHYLEQQFEDIRLQGWVGKREAHRAQTDVQYFFINGRVIRDRIINHAVRQAYGEALPAGRQPAYVLYLTLPLDRVDVNVHPTKHEVRFRDARLVHGLITRAVAEALEQDAPSQLTQKELSLTKVSGSGQVNEKQPDYSGHTMAKALPASPQPSAPVKSGELSLLVLHQRYAFITSPEPALFDLQQADRHLRQQQLQQAIRENTLTSRPILVPLKVELTSEELDLLGQHQDLLQTLALSFQIAPRAVAVKRIPYLLSQVDLHHLVTAVVTTLKLNKEPETALIDTLLSLLPVSAITSSEQARRIISQIDQQQMQTPDWYRKLDPATLSSLFSN